MKAALWSLPVAFLAALVVSISFSSLRSTPAVAAPKQADFWQVEDIRAGMKGEGRTVLKGTKIETFQVEMLGVLKNTSPGRDMILCQLSGLNLDKTGVIAGMSGSPVYIDNKLVGAVAYAWPFGKEPIAGITPFSQMRGYVESSEHEAVAEVKSARIDLRAPIKIDGKEFESVTVSERFERPESAPADSLWMMPLRTPLAATGFTPHSLKLLQERMGANGLLPMQGGGATTKIAEQEQETPLSPGSPLAVAMITGDFDLSGIGTVTHIEGDRVYGWGHPFFGGGSCEFPMMTGYIHTVYPRQTVSFKMGSPLRTVGIINADVSTCIAGWMNRKPDMLPVQMTVSRDPREKGKSFKVEVVRQRSMVASMVYTALTNSVDMEGELPEEMTAELHARIEVEGHDPIIIRDTYSGASYSGGRAPQALYYPIANLVSLMAYNSYKPVRINKIECETTILPGRRSAEIEAVELEADTYAPGDTLKATVFVRPYKGLRQRLSVTLRLPADFAEGNYSVLVCDDLTNARHELRDNPILSSPQNLSQVFDAIDVQTSAKRTSLVMRVATNAVGVALDGRSLPNLPPSMVHILAHGRRTGAQTMGGALVSRQNTDWVIQGSESVRFTVSKNKKPIE
ncbi:MAG TPA: SpoIVB peptidase S55 domain-containing protein [Gemmataceae bacterium]